MTDVAPDGAWTMDELLAAEAALEPADARLKYLFFWGHQPRADGAIGPHVLSQWYAHPFTADGVTYRTAEHFMMAGKARMFGDEERRDEILAADHPGEAKALGRRVRGFDERTWIDHRSEIVVAASVAKFASTGELRSYLVGTGRRVLVEASPRDRVWGIGMGRSNPDATRPSRWRGQNLLGFALMTARARLTNPSRITGSSGAAGPSTLE